MGRLQPPEPYHHSTHFLITFRHLAWLQTQTWDRYRGGYLDQGQ